MLGFEWNRGKAFVKNPRKMFLEVWLLLHFLNKYSFIKKANLGRTIKASRKPGLKRPLVIIKNGWPVCRTPVVGWVLGYFFKGVASYSTSPAGFSFYASETFQVYKSFVVKTGF